MNEKSQLIHVKLYAIGNIDPLSGISLKYDDKYPLILTNIISIRDFNRLMIEVHDVIISSWPCTFIYFISYILYPFHFVLSLMYKYYYISNLEKQIHKCLRNISLSSKFYDSNISITFHRSLFTGSYIEITFPNELLIIKQHNDIENNINNIIITNQPFYNTYDDYHNSNNNLQQHHNQNNTNNNIYTNNQHLLTKIEENDNKDEEVTPLLYSLTSSKRIKDN